MKRARILFPGILAITLAASGCGMFGVPMYDVYPDDYEQALVDTLDESPIVVDHEAAIDAWERASNIPPYEAEVAIADDAQLSSIQDLLHSLVAVSESFERTLPTFAVQNESMELMLLVSGNLTPQLASDGLGVALRDGWGRVQVNHSDNGTDAYLAGATATAEEARALMQEELPQSIQSADLSTRLHVEEITALETIYGRDGLVDPIAIDIAVALQPFKDDLPTTDGSAKFSIETRTTDTGTPRIHVTIEVRAEGLNDADPDDRPQIAQEMGYTDYCHEVESAIGESSGNASVAVKCVATHVDID